MIYCLADNAFRPFCGKLCSHVGKTFRFKVAPNSIKILRKAEKFAAFNLSQEKVFFIRYDLRERLIADEKVSPRINSEKGLIPQTIIRICKVFGFFKRMMQ